MAELLRSRPGPAVPFVPRDFDQTVFPVIRCVQEIPCNPCVLACPERLITIDGNIMGLPKFHGECLGCGECVSVCPGLAINLVFNDYDPTGEKALLLLPFELAFDQIPLGQEVHTVNIDGEPVGRGRVIAAKQHPAQDHRHMLWVEVPAADKLEVAGFVAREPSVPMETVLPNDDDDPIVCRCERIRKSAIVAEIRQGVRDLNQLKATSRASMGGCGGKTCTELVRRIFREEGISQDEITTGTSRPLVAETPLGAFVRGEEDAND